MFPYTLNRDRKLHCTKADRTQYLNSSNLFNSLTKSELEMCKIQTSKLTHTEHHENTWSQVSTDFLPKPSQQSRTQISPQHNESQTREENPKKKKKRKNVHSRWFLVIQCVSGCLCGSEKTNNSWSLYCVIISTPWQVRVRKIIWPVSYQSPAGRVDNPTPHTPGWWQSCEWDRSQWA